MSNLLLCLLVRHGIWNQFDHNVFKTIIATCKSMYKYVHSDKPLVQMLFHNLTFRRFYYSLMNQKFEGIRWNPNLIYERYHNDKQEGEHLEWHQNGKLKRKVFYRNGKEHGEQLEWYDNGQLQAKRFFQNDCLEAYMTWTYYGEHYTQTGTSN